MNTNIQLIINLINQWITQYAVDAFTNQRLNMILNLMCQEMLGLQGNASVSATLPLLVTSAQFTTATNCPLTAYAGVSLQIYWNDTNKFLTEGTDWTPLSGGGFQILISGFNAASGTFTFYIFS
jgi:hypothetical protein